MKEKGTKSLKETIILVIKIIFLAAVAGVIIAGKFRTTPDTVGETAWALVPPLVAIALALVTKEVYSSLFIGIVAGGLLYTGYAFEGTINHVYNEGFMVALIDDSYNIGILIFLIILGIIVCLMNRAGGSAAFGEWASTHIKTRVGAQLATILLGILIFIDDYFNCLTVGSVMRPVTDKHKVSRAKLAYLIDSTAAPICIIAPVSSWAAAVSGFVPGDENGIALFIRTIPYNFYALLTIVMMIALAISGTDFGPMALHEKNAREKDDLFTTPERPYSDDAQEKTGTKGKVIDLVFPVVVLVLFCVIGMIYTGGFFSGETFINAFAHSDASVGLVYGSFFALVVIIIYYLIRSCFSKLITFKEIMECIPEGFKSMVAPILILTFAWTLKNMTFSLGAQEFVAGVVERYADKFIFILPAIVFLVAVFLSFSTGTSWGTFGILIPIVVSIFEGVDNSMMIIAMSACMAGAVCGDHCSPISDTTIMSSAGAQCNHLNHVSTQIPYAFTCAIISGLCYFVAGFMRNPVVPLLIGAVIICLITFLPKYVNEKT